MTAGGAGKGGRGLLGYGSLAEAQGEGWKERPTCMPGARLWAPPPAARCQRSPGPPMLSIMGEERPCRRAAAACCNRGRRPARQARLTQHMHAQLQGLGAGDAGGVQARQVSHLLLRPHLDHLARVGLAVPLEARVPHDVPAKPGRTGGQAGKALGAWPEVHVKGAGLREGCQRRGPPRLSRQHAAGPGQPAGKAMAGSPCRRASRQASVGQ